MALIVRVKPCASREGLTAQLIIFPRLTKALDVRHPPPGLQVPHSHFPVGACRCRCDDFGSSVSFASSALRFCCHYRCYLLFVYSGWSFINWLIRAWLLEFEHKFELVCVSLDDNGLGGADLLALASHLTVTIRRWFCVLLKRLRQVLEVAIALYRLWLLPGSLLSEEKSRLIMLRSFWTLLEHLWLLLMYPGVDLAHKLFE